MTYGATTKKLMDGFRYENPPVLPALLPPFEALYSVTASVKSGGLALVILF